MRYLRSQMDEAELSFLGAIGDGPGDDDRLKEYADWLDGRGQHDQADLIRVQMAVEDPLCPESDPEVRGRLADLLGRARWSIRGLTDAARAVVEFDRGLPARVGISRRTRMGPPLAQLFAELPIAHVSVGHDDIGAVLDAARSARTAITVLAWVGRGRKDGGTSAVARGLMRIAADGTLAHITQLALVGIECCAAQAKVLSRAPFIPELRALTIHNCGLTTAALEPIINRCGRHLALLELSRNPLGDGVVELLANAAPRLDLRMLGLSGVGLGPAGGRLLAESDRFAAVFSLGYRGNQLGDARRSLKARFGPLRPS